MSRIAVDIVLLPEESVSERTIKANQDLVRRHGRHIVLDRATCLPHVSLAMGCIEIADVEPVGRALETIAGGCPAGDLVITGIATTLNALGQQVSAFVLAQTEALRSLHERVMNEMQSHFSYDVTAQMVHGDEEVAPTTLAWIRNYREKAAFRAFIPHITIGYGMVTEPMTFPIRFAASRLALCHLGNHCTCRKVLASAQL
jgi:2'-5' RNA ligase